VVARAEHGQRRRFQRRQMAAQRRGRELPGDAQEQAHLHVCRLAVGRYVQRRRVLMTVDEDQAGTAVVVAQAIHGAEQHRALTAVDDREAIGGQRGTHVLAQRVDQRQQGSFVHQPRAGGATRVGGRQPEIGPLYPALTEGALQAGVAQRLGRASLVPDTTEAVKRGADQLYQQLIRTVPESSTANTIPLPLAPW
jgi:hypothetical protein